MSVAGERGLHVWDIEPDAGHAVLGRDVMPAASYMQRALSGASEALAAGRWELRDVRFHAVLPRGRRTQLVIEESAADARFNVYSRADKESSWHRHASGCLVRSDEQRPSRVDLDAIRARCVEQVSPSAFYDRLSRQGLDYNASFRLVLEARVGTGEALTRLRAEHLDACLQGLSWAAGFDADDVRLPAKVARVALHAPFNGEVWAWARWQNDAGTVIVARGDGEVIAEIEGLGLTGLAARSSEWMWELAWEAAPLSPPGASAGRWLVVGRGSDEVAARLRRRGAVAEVATADNLSWEQQGLDGVIWLSTGSEIDGVVALVQAHQRLLQRTVPRLYLVTHGTQPVGEGSRSPDGAELWGLSQVVQHEHPRLQCRVIDVSLVPNASELDGLVEEISADSLESRVVLRGAMRYVPRLRRMQARADVTFTASPNATYLITGGLGGLGLAVAGRLVDRGARHLVLVGRTDPDAEAARQVRAFGVDARVAQADVGDRREMASLLEQIGTTMPPLRGIVHAAGVFDDGLLADVTPERMARVMRPKRIGAWNLHELTKDNRALDFFVMFSSAASVLGSAGQAAYAAANAWLDAFADYRRALGLPALSINWGHWAEVGSVADADHAAQLEAQGIGPMSSADALDVLELAIAGQSTHAIVMSINFRQWSERFPHVACLPMFQSLGDRAVQSQVSGLTEGLRSLGHTDRMSALAEHVRTQVAAVLRLPAGSLADAMSFFSCGLDSMTALELRNRLENILDVMIPVTAIWRFPTVSALSTHLADQIQPATAASASDDADLAHVLEAALDLAPESGSD